MELIYDARDFAVFAHKNQTRKYTGEPYWRHCARVAELVEQTRPSDVMVACAWLHDVLEDTPVTFDELRERFGHRVADVVRQLTKMPAPNKPRSARHAEEVARLSKIEHAAQTIKLADIIDNVSTIASLDPKFAAVYVDEKADQVDVLTNGEAALMRMAQYEVRKARRHLARLSPTMHNQPPCPHGPTRR